MRDSMHFCILHFHPGAFRSRATTHSSVAQNLEFLPVSEGVRDDECEREWPKKS